MTKQILLSKYWIEDGELEIVEVNNKLDKATKGDKNNNADDEIILEDDLNADKPFELEGENIDLTDGTRFDFTHSGQMDIDTAMPDTV